jgi:hypothetical protein
MIYIIALRIERGPSYVSENIEAIDPSNDIHGCTQNKKRSFIYV